MNYPPSPRTHATPNPLGAATPSRFQTAHVRPPLFYRLSRLLNLHHPSLHSTQCGGDSDKDESIMDASDGLLILNDVDLDSIRSKLENILLAANHLRELQVTQAPGDDEPISGTDTLGEYRLIPLNIEVEMVILGIILDTYDLQKVLSVGYLGVTKEGAAENIGGEGDRSR
ncbi:hypothetical protein VKT23_014016 [Stygiomarasmius scandens]|uniref:Uncharacterized protein n=1 Tax=Marasmiellus scandens TaxID=2682957 RepID=A0ABR1J6E7_9AGAR